MAVKAVAHGGKILRIGVIHGGRIIEERLLRKSESITVGDSPKSTFILPFSEASSPKLFPLFPYKGDGYQLAFTDSMSGKVSVGAEVLDLQDFVKSGKAKKHGSTYVMPLGTDMKGKVQIGEATFLFQFISAPPIPPKPKLPASIRNGWVKGIDWPFVIIFSISFFVHAAIFGYASTQPVPKKLTLEKLPERFAQFIVEEMPKEEKAPEVKEGEGDTVAKKEENKKSEQEEQVAEEENAGEQRQLTPEEEAEQAAKRRAEIAKKVAGMGLNAMLTSKGPGGENVMAAVGDALAEGGRFGDIDDTMSGITGVGVMAKSAEKSRIGGGGGGPQSKDIDKVGVSGGGGKAKMEGRQEEKIRGQVKTGAGMDIDGSLDSSAVKNVVNRNIKAIYFCYESELRLNPKLEGKVTVEFTIARTGTVTDARVISSTLHSAKVEGCMIKTIKRWRFPRPDDEAIIAYPFVFQAAD